MQHLRRLLLSIIAPLLCTYALAQYHTLHASGNQPTVTTDTRYARGATMAFGRMSYTGVSASDVSEQGFCYGECEEPTINDSRTTKYLNNNGRIYWLENLKPATEYHMRAYVITKGQQVGYGDIIRFYTIPKGQIALSLRSSSDAAADARIKAAAETAIGYWNALTEIKGFTTSIGYNSGVPTAECSYGGWMSVGSNQSYQRPGTIMHELLHGIGVIPWADTEWSRFNLRAGTSNGAGFTTGSGLWLGDRVTEVLRFWDNSTTAQLNGDYQHMWPYGINGAHEDNGSDVLYIGNSLICQALGEDGLQHTGQLFAEPYHALDHHKDVKYYIKNEDVERGLHTSYLTLNSSGGMVWRTMAADEAATNDSCAWYIDFTPANQYYQLRNAATGRYLSYSFNTMRTTPRTIPTSSEDFQLMKGRVDVCRAGIRGYWIIHPESNWTPHCLQANANGTTAAATFDIANSATTQRWLILTEEEMRSLDNYMVTQMQGQVNARLNQLRALMAVPHTVDTPDVDTALEETVSNIESQMATANTSQLSNLINEAEEAAFLFLCHATPRDLDQPFDLTYLLQNPGMDSTEGWSDSPTLSYSCAEYYERTFDFFQTVNRLPGGTYQMRSNAFQRPGKAEECTSRPTTAYIYAGGKSERLAHITTGAQGTKQGGSESYVNGRYFPNNMQAASIYFGKGLYENKVTTTLDTDGGQLTMGIRGTTADSYYWCIFDNFRLYYYGALDATQVQEYHWQKGDVNCDGTVSVADVSSLVQHILGTTPRIFSYKAANVNEDSELSVGDVTGIVNIILRQ